MSRRLRPSRAVARRARLRRRQAKRLARKPSAILHALTSSAMALPGLAQRAAAESAPTEVRTDYRYSRYSEQPLKNSQVEPGGETDRYEIDIHQFRFETGITDRVDIGVELAHETMSGASPWYIVPGPNGDPIQVMTEATIDEARTDALVSSNLYLDRGKATLGVGASYEKDYLAISGRLGGERQFNEKNTTLSGGFGFSVDQLSPSDTDQYPNRPDSEDKQTYDFSLGLAQVLGRTVNVQTSLSYRLGMGYLSDPYKQAYVGTGPETDVRPDERHQLAWLTRYRQNFTNVGATLHLDYQFGYDDWEVNSHTIELAWYQTLWDRFRVIPSLRYYSQSQAYFYAPYYVTPRSDGLRSSDYRLAPFGALAWQIKTEARFQTWNLVWDASFAYQRYISDANLALQSVSVENPGLVSYDLFTVGLTARF